MFRGCATCCLTASHIANKVRYLDSRADWTSVPRGQDRALEPQPFSSWDPVGRVQSSRAEGATLLLQSIHLSPEVKRTDHRILMLMKQVQAFRFESGNGAAEASPPRHRPHLPRLHATAAKRPGGMVSGCLHCVIYFFSNNPGICGPQWSTQDGL